MSAITTVLGLLFCFVLVFFFSFLILIITWHSLIIKLYVIYYKTLSEVPECSQDTEDTSLCLQVFIIFPIILFPVLFCTRLKLVIFLIFKSQEAEKLYGKLLLEAEKRSKPDTIYHTFRVPFVNQEILSVKLGKLYKKLL